MYKEEKEWEGIDYREWNHVPVKDIACYEYAQKEEEQFPLPEEAFESEGTPRGRMEEHDWESHLIYPGVKGKYWVYIPAQYQGQEVKLMVFLDGGEYIQQARVPAVLDNLIAARKIPVMAAVFVDPGDRGPGLPRYGGTDNRSVEYDSTDGAYAEFLEKEILCEVKKNCSISENPLDHGICGISSSGNAAFAAAWNRNDLFTRVLTHVGSFVNIRGGHNFPSMIRQNPRKNIKMFLQTGEHDLNTYFGDWVIANQDMASSLRYKDYDYRLVIGPGGHSMRYGASILPESLIWLWNDEK